MFLEFEVEIFVGGVLRYRPTQWVARNTTHKSHKEAALGYYFLFKLLETAAYGKTQNGIA